jgi:hypothetical protein
MADFFNGLGNDFKQFTYDSGIRDAWTPIGDTLMDSFQTTMKSSVGMFSSITKMFSNVAGGVGGLFSGSTIQYIVIAGCVVAGAYGVSVLYTAYSGGSGSSYSSYSYR